MSLVHRLVLEEGRTSERAVSPHPALRVVGMIILAEDFQKK
jgi:hypothetical protein